MLLYRYRGIDIGHRDNVGLREAMRLQVPLIYFHGIVPGRYMASWPVYIVGDEPAALTFKVAVDDRQFVSVPVPETPETEIRRRSVSASLLPTSSNCAICRLRHQELLEAAHIVADRDPEGEPKVSNGLALCKLHHAAFDCHIIGVNPDYRVEVRLDVLEEIDGPMLQHGLQGFHGSSLWLPSKESLKPDQRFLEERYALFRQV